MLSIRQTTAKPSPNELIAMSMTKRNGIKCDECGRFISIQDLMDEKAIHTCVSPDSDWSAERFESLCAKCNNGDPRTPGYCIAT